MAVDMGFHHFILDIRDEFGDAVIDNFVDEYLAGRTPIHASCAIPTSSGMPFSKGLMGSTVNLLPPVIMPKSTMKMIGIMSPKPTICTKTNLTFYGA